jgi:hypothetical protein
MELEYRTLSELPREPFAWMGELMSTFPHTWFVCGGWAADAWLGRQTREHGDFDISIFHDDQGALFDHLAGWHMVAHGAFEPGASTDPWDGRPLGPTSHIHARPPGEQNLKLLQAWVRTPGSRPIDGLDVEILLNERDGDAWVLEREPRISRALATSVQRSPVGLPMATPEILMYFKATAYRGVEGYPRPRDFEDFVALAPLLASPERTWLRSAIAIVDAGHSWLSYLRG